MKKHLSKVVKLLINYKANLFITSCKSKAPTANILVPLTNHFIKRD